MKHDPRCQGIPTKVQVQANIEGPHGVHLTGVLGEPHFVYTTGLYPRIGAEILVFGIPPKSAAVILNDIADHVKKGEGEPLRLDTPDDRWCNLPVVFKKTNPRLEQSYPANVAHDYYRKQVPVWQMVLCDKLGRFPWDENFDFERMSPAQSLLYGGDL